MPSLELFQYGGSEGNELLVGMSECYLKAFRDCRKSLLIRGRRFFRKFLPNSSHNPYPGA